ncbi:MAG: hypothetical protein IPJ20_08925 [Flammeovirgaceae bacterium]|nr:hypothetical protein [Flammeovirgaceae bacterium]
MIIGIKKNFEGIGWLVMILIGTFLCSTIFQVFLMICINMLFLLGSSLWVVFFSSIGVGFGITRSEKARWGDGVITSDEGGEDYFDLTTVFGGNKRKYFRKTLKEVKQRVYLAVPTLIFRRPTLMAR